MNYTKCIVCGKRVSYKTKKPKYCPECRTKSNKPRKPKGKANNNPKSKWKSERYMYKVLSELMPKAEYCLNGYYSFLPSPKGEAMQLDWYSYELGLAFE